jgi:hypothetical protein
MPRFAESGFAGVTSPPPFLRFETLVKQLLTRRGFDLEPKPDARVDVFAIKEGERWVIEIKYYRTARAQIALLDAAASTILLAGRQLEAQRGLLVVSSVVPPALRRSFEERFGLVLADRSDVLAWAADAPDVSDELDALLEIPPDSRLDVAPSPAPASDRRLVPSQPIQPNTEGDQLCATLRGIPKGKAGWRPYEEHCERILKYLFPADLSGWHKQKRTDDGLNRFDYVCRIRPTTEFWKFLIDHLGSRYVLFEFKNYRGMVTQTQILTTEKYLLEKGLRRVAIVFTRAGADKSAIGMAQGAMREHGKLMLLVSDAHVCKLLQMKQSGADPTDLLFDLADDFLLSLPR